MRIEKCGDVVSFDGGTMASREALLFAIELANTAWRFPGAALTLCTVEEAIAIRDIVAAQAVHPDIPQNPFVTEIRRDRHLQRIQSSHGLAPSGSPQEGRQ